MGLNRIVFQLSGVGMLPDGAQAVATSNEIALISSVIADLAFVLLVFTRSKELREAK